MARILKKKDEKDKVEEMHQRKAEKMIKSAERSAGLLHKITNANDVERRSADSEGGRRRREIVRSL